MRTVWLCMLIALMPLRLWAGGAMLVQHHVPASTPAQATATPVEVAVAAAEPPCHAAPAPAEAAPLAPHDHGHDGTETGTEHLGCSACDICHTLAHPWVGTWQPWLATPQPPPAHRAAAPASARLAPAFKPPIA
ncbi:hypothetical protein [Aquabacterium sp. A08]|uniref:hypothetical protein n=1 Tax=Aquabacterium sp. A08 TaxID=2718532 RepID=UPI001423EB91|nr:hypothetical protein [Aquabacterium sp. A08]NIC39721.1 hypothetical protein [Aquabacterium sp. A08]